MDNTIFVLGVVLIKLFALMFMCFALWNGGTLWWLLLLLIVIPAARIETGNQP